MISATLERLERTLPDDALVLDVGGYIRPWARADWVIDIMPYDGRGPHGRDGTGPERFSSDTWVQRDICAREPWPFEDNQFDFVTCSQTLEDIRDPVGVCDELVRVAKAGYVEVPSLWVEHSWGIQGPWVGWGHHHWFCHVRDGGIEFVFKHHVVHSRRGSYFPDEFHLSLSEEDRVQQLWWEGSFRYEERPIMDIYGLDQYLEEFVRERYPEHGAALGDRVLTRAGSAMREWGMKLESRGRRQANARSTDA
jgi:hypothetical protein